MIIHQGAYAVLTLLFRFSATYLYDYTFILLYNLVFTSLPVVILGGRSDNGTLRDRLLMCYV